MRTVQLAKNTKPILYGEAPYGWTLSPDRSRLVKNADEQRVLSVVRNLYGVDRLPMRVIVERLRKMKVRNRRGRPFGLSGVWEIIHKRNGTPSEAKARPR